MSRVRIRSLVAGALALLGAAACGGGGTQAGDEDGARPLRVVTSYAVESLSPVEQGLWAPEWGYGELLMRATEEGTVEPWVLAGLDRAGDTAWDLRLRDGVTFQNGRALDADGLVALLTAHLDHNSRAASALPGATARAVDAATVRLTTARPLPNVPNLLADETVFPVFDARAAAEAGEGNAALADAGIWTGPFTVTSLTADALTLARDPDYWGGDVRLPGVEVRFVPDGQARVLAVRGGEADLAFYPPTEALRGLSGAEVVEATGGATPLRGFLNTRAAPLDDPAVRRALALAVDHEALATDVLDGFYRTPLGMYPETVPYAEATVRTDRDEAAALLDAAGWTRDGDGDGPRTRDGETLALTVVSYSTQPDTRVVATALQAQLRESGFAVEVRDVPANYEAMAETSDWHVGLSFDSSLGTTFDPRAKLRDFLHSAGQYNFGGVADARLDALIEELDTVFDTARQDELLRRAQEITDEEAYALFLTERPARVVAGPGWEDYRASSVLQHVGPRT
ncbi:ABC transporter substrate-binding protein [Streptomyces avicenniae]|uniref:ABC transporter substrate-binding protein n=1 Tax=Streptomyces avicenniae TaxID=500153 RepID=UPI00069B3787|nr:ABC transporter substrate-binding protein [Streptomyces avicenniae]